MKEPYYQKCPECDNDFSCFFRHATKEQKEGLIVFAANEGWKEQENLINKP